MRALFIIASLLCCGAIEAAHLTVQRAKGGFVLNQDGVVETIDRRNKWIKVDYELYDQNESYRASACCYQLWRGTSYDLNASFTIYDAKGRPLCMVEGPALSWEPSWLFKVYSPSNRTLLAEFSFSKKSGSFDRSQSGRSVAYAHLRLQEDGWDVEIAQASKLDERIIKLLAAYALDYMVDFTVR